MNRILDILVIVLVTAAAVWYLYRKFVGAFKGGQSACGCSGCSGCSQVDPKKKTDA